MNGAMRGLKARYTFNLRLCGHRCFGTWTNRSSPALRFRRICCSIQSRWGSLAERAKLNGLTGAATPEAGGRGRGGICLVRDSLCFEDRLVATDRLTIDTGELMDPALAQPTLEQREYRALQMLLQDVHSLVSFFFEGDKNKRPATLHAVAQRPSREASGGGVWVPAGDRRCPK